MSRKSRLLRRTLEACVLVIGYTQEPSRHMERFTILETTTMSVASGVRPERTL